MSSLLLGMTASLAMLAVMLVLPASAEACKCKRLSLEQKIELADVIFVGYVGVSNPDGAATFVVERVFKGEPERFQTFPGPQTNCGIWFEKGDRWLVFGPVGNGNKHVSRCLGSMRFSGDDEPDVLTELVEVLGEGTVPPSQDDDPRSGADDDTDEDDRGAASPEGPSEDDATASDRAPTDANDQNDAPSDTVTDP